MKLNKIINAINGLEYLSKLAIPAKESFKLAMLINSIEPSVNNYNKQRNNLLAKYGNSEDGKTFTIREAEKENFIDEIEDLGNIEIDLKFEKINIPNNLTIEASNLINILDFIEIVK